VQIQIFSQRKGEYEMQTDKQKELFRTTLDKLKERGEGRYKTLAKMKRILKDGYGPSTYEMTQLFTECRFEIRRYGSTTVALMYDIQRLVGICCKKKCLDNIDKAFADGDFRTEHEKIDIMDMVITLVQYWMPYCESTGTENDIISKLEGYLKEDKGYPYVRIQAVRVLGLLRSEKALPVFGFLMKMHVGDHDMEKAIRYSIELIQGWKEQISGGCNA
jgi:hypothetical protein